MNFKTVLSILGMVLTFALIILSIVKIWAPEMIDNDMFVKMILSFAVLAFGSIIIQFLSGRSPQKEEEDKKD